MKKLVILVAALALVATSAMTAAAAEWNFYGSARVSTWYTETDTINGTAETEDFAEALQGNSRIGANVKVSDELTGRFEYGTGVNVRILWGEWNFGAGSLGVGQHYTPLNLFYSNQVYGSDNDMLAQGGVYGGRAPMLRLKFGDFQVAAVQTNTNGLGTAFNISNDFPAFEAKYTMKFDAVSVAVTGGYNSYELEDTAANQTYDVDSYVLALGGKADIGPAYVAGNIYTGQNPGNLMGNSVGGDNAWNDGLAAIAGTEVRDNDAMGFILLAGFKANDMFAFELGYGYNENELDQAASDDQVSVYYIQSTITLAPGVFITPEIGYFDGEEDGQTETMYYGAKWQINF